MTRKRKYMKVPKPEAKGKEVKLDKALIKLAR